MNEKATENVPQEETRSCRKRCKKILAILKESHVMVETINGPHASEDAKKDVNCTLDRVLALLDDIEQSVISLNTRLAQIDVKI